MCFNVFKPRQHCKNRLIDIFALLQFYYNFDAIASKL